MKFSLVTVVAETAPGIISGVWIQNHVGTLASATQRAINIEKANSNRIQVAVVEDLNFTEPNYSLRTGLRRLDNPI